MLIGLIAVGLVTFVLTCILSEGLHKAGVFQAIVFVPGLLNKVILNCV